MSQDRLVGCSSIRTVSAGNEASLEYLWETRYLTAALTHQSPPTPLPHPAPFLCCLKLGFQKKPCVALWEMRSIGKGVYLCAANAVNSVFCVPGWLAEVLLHVCRMLSPSLTHIFFLHIYTLGM